MVDLMVDIETLGLEPGSVITDIGVALFDPKGDGVIRSAQWAIYVHDAQAQGLTIDWSTVEWWHRQESRTRDAIFDCELTQRSSLKQALSWLKEWVHGSCWWADAPPSGYGIPDRVWAKGPQFDHVLLEHAYRACGMMVPWQYKQPRDVRTLLDAAGNPHVRTPEGFVEHDPEWDCILQVLEVQRAFKELAR